MKHYLPLLLIAFGFACKKTNSTIGPNKMLFDHSTYLYLPHNEDQSILRRKLLHQNLAKNLNQSTDVVIAEGDEFDFINNPFLLENNEKKNYENFQLTCAEVIASYKDHQEIYFVPTGIDKENALAQLDLRADLGNKLTWVKEPERKLVKGNKYYLLSTNLDEMKNNDSNFYQTQILYKDFNEETFKFKKNQKIILDFKLDYFLKQTEVVTRSSPNVRKCTKDMNEAGLCNGCDYYIESFNGNLVKSPWKQDDFSFSLKINNKNYDLSLLEATIKNDHLIIKIDLKTWNIDEDVQVQILPFVVPGLTRVAQGYNYSSQCFARSNSNAMDLTPILKSDLTLTVLGRSFI